MIAPVELPAKIQIIHETDQPNIPLSSSPNPLRLTPSSLQGAQLSLDRGKMESELERLRKEKVKSVGDIEGLQDTVKIKECQLAGIVFFSFFLFCPFLEDRLAYSTPH